MTPQDVIRQLGELPPLPTVATRVVRLSADASCATDELHDLISVDQALSAQVLKVANSAMFGMSRSVTTLHQALLTLGFSTTRSVVLAASVKNLFSRGPAGPEERILWEHALVTGLTASAFGRSLKLGVPDEVFLAGLLHDVGKGVLALKFPESYQAILRRLHQQGGAGQDLEHEAFGFDHTQVGQALLESWDLWEGLGHAARWHHEPLLAPRSEQRLVALVALGNQAALDLQVGLGSPESLDGATWEAMDLLQLTEATYQAHRTTALEALERDKTLIASF